MSRAISTLAFAGVLLAACGQADEETSRNAAEPVLSEPVAATAEISDMAVEVVTDDESPEAENNPIETIGYPEGWELIDFWSGEYPNAFSVTREGVTAMAYEAIEYQSFPPIYCGMPYKATYSPWNTERSENDGLRFVTMTYPTKITLKEDVSVDTFQGDVPIKLQLSAGDELIYKTYLAEGFFIAEKDGTQYELLESDLPQSTEFESGPEDQEWVQVTCDDGEKTRAWILFSEVLDAQGIERYNYTDFGTASDLP